MMKKSATILRMFCEGCGAFLCQWVYVRGEGGDRIDSMLDSHRKRCPYYRAADKTEVNRDAGELALRTGMEAKEV